MEAGRRRAWRWVLKRIDPSREGAAALKLREDFCDLASLGHPALGLPTSLHIGQDGERYIVRPYVEGAEIASASQDRSPKAVLPWLLSAAEALGILHRFGFLHRNLKPSNLIVLRATIHARQARDHPVVLCDAAWWAGEAADFASDLYGLGTVFYRVLTGKEVRPGETGFPPSLSELNPEVPLDLERSVMKLLHPEPGRRYQSAAALIDDLKRLWPGRPRTPRVPPECFVDRKGELAQALSLIDPPGRRAVLAVTGEAGRGKSAFLKRLSIEAQRLGYLTASVRFFLEQGPPLGPIRSLAEQLIARSPSSRSLRSRYRRVLDQSRGGERGAFLRGLLDFFDALDPGRPVVLMLDDVHLADSLSIGFLAGLAADTGSGTAPAGRSARVLVFSYRSESSFRAALGPLLAALSPAAQGHLTIELPTLHEDAVEEWLNLTLEEPGAEGVERAASRLGGHPFLIREAIRFGGGRRASEAIALGSNPAALHVKYLRSLESDEQNLLRALAVLGRPAPADLLRAILDSADATVQTSIRRLTGDGTLSDEGGQVFFKHGSFHAWLLGALGKSARRGLHRRVAVALVERRESVEEVARHWLHSDRPRKGIPAALEAARSLARDHEDRRALVFLRSALDLLPPGDRRRRAILEEAAEAHGRTGDHRRGIELLGQVLLSTRGLEAARLNGRIGIHCHRAGEAARAVLHLEKGLSLLDGARGERWFLARLRIESELAEIKSDQGDYARAEAICGEALREIEERKEAAAHPEVLRARMVLLENLAHLRLRQFRFAEARDLFERSLRAGEGLGPVPERSLILNNLGILHIQENRFRDAIECYRSAERLSTRLGDDQSLAAIQCNLAALHAKTGEPEAADEALRRAARHDLRCDSSRTRFLRLHSAGLVDLIAGRYASAIESFQAAIALGEELRDLHTLAFDLAYLGECHLYRGESRAAREAFERALGLGAQLPAPVGRMVLARRTLLSAQRGDARGAAADLEAWGRTAPGVPYLEAWNGVFLGWAHRLLRQWEPAQASLEEARSFFARARVPAGEIHSSLELAALEADTGRLRKGARRLQALRSRERCGQGALRNPMLCARLLAYQTRLLLEEKDPDLGEAASGLVEAESYLIGRRLQDLEALARDLRRRIRLLGLGRRSPALPPLPGGQAGVLEELDLLRGSASDLVRQVEDEIGEEKAAALRRHLRDFEERLSGARRSIEAKRAPATPCPRVDAVLGSSPAIRKVASLCLQVAGSSLPVLITGETGTGKELVARVIHAESPRRSAAFVSLSSAALPAELLEAELFGYVRGAFTGAEADRDGLLRTAQGGTFLFDEIGEMPLPLQGKLLRVLETGRVRPLGGAEEIALDVRYLFTTSRDLRALLGEGKFRQDLFYRLRALEVALPPLRERLQDLPELVSHFQAQAGADGAALRFGEDALRELASHPWPGNVRELAGAITRLVLTARGKIGAEGVRRYLDGPRAESLFSRALLRSRPLPQLLADLEREYLLQLHADHGGDLLAVARALGIRLRALYDRLKRLGIKPRELE